MQTRQNWGSTRQRGIRLALKRRFAQITSSDQDKGRNSSLPLLTMENNAIIRIPEIPCNPGICWEAWDINPIFSQKDTAGEKSICREWASGLNDLQTVEENPLGIPTALGIKILLLKTTEGASENLCYYAENASSAGEIREQTSAGNKVRPTERLWIERWSTLLGEKFRWGVSSVE